MKRENDEKSRESLSTRGNETRFNTYRERITGDEEINSNEEESSILSDLFSVEKESKEDSRDNEINEKDVSEQ